MGDSLLAAGQASDLYRTDPARGPIRLIGSDGHLRWNPVWQDNPVVATAHDPALRSLVTGKGHLPYLQYPYTLESGWRFTDWRARDHRGALFLSAAERDLSPRTPFILIEPTAERKHINRRPRRWFWDLLVTALRAQTDLPLVQLAHPQADLLRGVSVLHNETFRDACGVLSGAACLVTTEGGLPHAAAALGVPAVVLWGGHLPVENLGYPEHVNIATGPACGALVDCAHCRAIWDAVDPVAVADAVVREIEAVRVIRQPDYVQPWPT